MSAAPASPPAAWPGNLTRQEAAARSASISKVSYAVTLDLSRGGDEFGCQAFIRFMAGPPNRAMFLDYAGTVDRAECNGTRLGPDAFGGARIHLPVNVGHNEVRVHGTAPYGRAGAGLHRFHDPGDGHVYLHTKFEPFDAHRVYPCFDQPDLKASFDLAVKAPAGWRIIANSQPSGEPTPVTNRHLLWKFARTPPLPPYLTAIAAGPFRSIASAHRGLPLTLYARGALLEALVADAEELFGLTRQGLDFYTRFFGRPYPFDKYDQVFVPEYSFGAMEHPGCVTFNERFIFRSRVTDESRRGRAEVLLHEMAHMWFGNLVTMRWWDDLWLNESFATLMAALAQAEATRFGTAWVSFAHRAGAAARHADQLPTSHPIAADTTDTDAVRLSFDPITYKKGAIVLRQLADTLGRDTFMKGVRSYLDRHAWANADLGDLIAALQDTAAADLGDWADEWVRRPGVTTVQAWLDSAGFHLTQTADPPAAPRTLRLRIGSYAMSGDAIRRRACLHVDIEATRPAVLDAGKHGALSEHQHLVLPNDDDLGYVKVRLDPCSRRTVLHRLSKLDDAVARAVAWGALWDEVLDARLAAREFVACVLNHGAGEQDIGVLELLWERAAQAALVYGDPANATRALGRMCQRSLAELDTALPGSDRQLVWARILSATACSAGELAELEPLAGGRTRWTGLEVDADLRWRLLLRLAVAGRASGELIAAAAAADPSEEGRRRALATAAARPEPRAKEDGWRQVFDVSRSLAERRAIMTGLQQPGQKEVLAPYIDRYFTELRGVWATAGPEFALAFTRALYPRFSGAEHQVLSRTEAGLQDRQLVPEMVRVLREEQAELTRALATRTCDSAAGIGPPHRDVAHG